MSKFIVFLSPHYVHNQLGGAVGKDFLALRNENVFSLSHTSHILCPTLLIGTACEALCYFEEIRNVFPIEDENIGGEAMKKALQIIPINFLNFQEFAEMVSEEIVRLLKNIGCVIVDTVEKYLSDSNVDNVLFVIAPAIVGIAYAVATLNDYWDLLDTSLINGGFIFEKTENEILLLQHLR